MSNESPISEKNRHHEGAKRSSIEKSSDILVNDDLSSLDTRNGDEALQLVGARRTHQFSEEYYLQLRKKLDWRIPPLCAAVYFTQFLDKTSLNYASIMGFTIVGQRYNLVSAAFYFGFLFWEFPTVYIAQRLPLAKYLGCNVICWGAILMIQASTSNFAAFFVLRFILGMLESCVAPILLLIISMFYRKSEQGRRVSWFYVMNGLTQIFGGFVAYGISFYDGGKIVPYKIVFVLLGGLAIIVGICVITWLPDSPVRAHFLTEEERIAALERVRDDQGGTENKHFKKDQVWDTVTDVRSWLIVLSTLLTSIPNGGLSNFSNLIIKAFGYTSRQTLILSTPAGAIAACMTLACGWYSDRKRERMIPIVFALLPTIAGAAILIGLNGRKDLKGVLLFAVYLIGTFGSALSIIYAYNATNVSGNTKRNTLNAMTLVSFSVGNIVGTEIFLPKDAPDYVPGKTAIMILLTIQLFVCFLLRWINIRLNKKKRDAVEELKARNNWSDVDLQKERERHAFADLTDRQNIYFEYSP